MNEYPPLKFPGEPDALTEVRLRQELKWLRYLATLVANLDRDRQIAYERWPGVYEATEILAPPGERALLEEHERIKPVVKARLLQVEHYFVQKGWHLPKWRRPGWIQEG